MKTPSLRRYSIRYGVGNMPGYAAATRPDLKKLSLEEDCGDLNDNFAASCSTIVPLSEEKLRDVPRSRASLEPLRCKITC